MNIPVSSPLPMARKKKVWQVKTSFDGLSVYVSVLSRNASDILQSASMVIKVSDPTIMPRYSDIQHAVMDLFSTEDADVDPAQM